MDTYLISIITAGLAGGVLRGLVGYFKYHFSYREVKFKPRYFLALVGISGLVGLLAAWITDDLGLTLLGLNRISPAIALIIGYAGGDFIENVFKIITGKTSLYLPKN